MINYKFLFIFLLLNTSIAMSQNNETQEYKIVNQIDDVEIRYYPSAAMIKAVSYTHLRAHET